MRVLAVCCHPASDSLHAALRSEMLGRLAADGHELVVLDLYAERFDPVLRETEWRDYWSSSTKAADVERHVAELRTCEALVLIYPTWWYGLPAIMKGWLDRIWLPGVAFDIRGGRIVPHMLSNIRRFAVVTTHGSPWWLIRGFMGEPGRKQVIRGLRRHMARQVKVSWNPLYGVDTREWEDIEAWIEATARRLGRFLAG